MRVCNGYSPVVIAKVASQGGANECKDIGIRVDFIQASKEHIGQHMNTAEVTWKRTASISQTQGHLLRMVRVVLRRWWDL